MLSQIQGPIVVDLGINSDRRRSGERERETETEKEEEDQSSQRGRLGLAGFTQCLFSLGETDQDLLSCFPLFGWFLVRNILPQSSKISRRQRGTNALEEPLCGLQTRHAATGSLLLVFFFRVVRSEEGAIPASDFLLLCSPFLTWERDAYWLEVVSG